MKKKNNKSRKDKEVLIIDEVFSISKKKGNGLVKRQVWEDGVGNVTRYSLSYVNPHLFQGDNGRVLGYDNAHGYHHKHFKGVVTPMDYESFEDIEIRFQQEFEVIYAQSQKK